MAQEVLIQLTTAGIDTGPFNLYSNIDGFFVPFETSVPKLSLEAGYLSILVPDGAETIRVKSANALCSNYIDLTIVTSTTTTTSTSSTTTTTTTIAGSVSITVDSPIVHPYPISGGFGSASGTVSNTIGYTVYIYAVFNSGGNNTGSVNTDSGSVNSSPLTMSGTVTSFGQTIRSTTYYALTDGSLLVGWTLSKNDGLSSGATLRLGYSSSIGGPLTLL